MKKFYEEQKKLNDIAIKVEPTLNHIRNIIKNAPKNKYGKRIFYSYEKYETQEGIGSIEWMYKWDDHPIVITVWRKPVEFIYDHVLSVLRFRFNCEYTMESWNEIQKIVFNTKIKDIPVYIQLIDAQKCEWKKVVKEGYELDCAAA